jgi:hypothetical protein
MRYAAGAVVFAVITVSQGAVGAAATKNCRYADSAYKEGALSVHGATCQQCQDGKWFDKDKQFCQAAAAPAPAIPDLDAVAICVDSDGRMNSEGAYRVNKQKCQQCQANTQWFDRDNVFCMK